MRHRRDNTHRAIVEALRSVGAFVVDTSSLGLFADLVVSFAGVWHVIEVKNPETFYGRNGLNPNQQHLATMAGSAPVHVVSSVADALRVIGVCDASTDA